MRDLSKLFYPENIAFIGASENLRKWGGFLFVNMIDGPYRDRVYPVSKNGKSIFGMAAYASVLDIPAAIDCAVITIPAVSVMDAVTECATKGIRNIVMVTSGFSETGPEGVELEKRLIEYVRKNDINLVGPNTMGFLNSHKDLYATGANVRPPKGGISIIAQSGNVGIQFLEWALDANIGISKFIGSGNEAVLTAEDYLEYLYNDDDTSVILMYLEGLRDGRRFLEIAKKVTSRKPIVLLKSGKTESGSRAAASHTGSLAGSYQVFEGAMKQAGIIIADSLSELLFLATAFDCLPNPHGNRIGIITIGGGWGVVTADDCEERGLTLPPLPESVKKGFDEILPPFWSKSNPVDLVGTFSRDVYKKSVGLMISSDQFDAIVVLGVINSMKLAINTVESTCRLGFTQAADLDNIRTVVQDASADYIDYVLDLMKQYRKPVYQVALVITDETELVYSKKNCPYKLIIYKSPEEAVLCIQKQLAYSKYRQERGL